MRLEGNSLVKQDVDYGAPDVTNSCLERPHKHLQSARLGEIWQLSNKNMVEGVRGTDEMDPATTGLSLSLLQQL